MPSFEILCVTMAQTDFSKIQEMNIYSDVVFANQADTTGMKVHAFNGHLARMITTDTRGVGINRNLALLYARGDICLFADDDITYDDDMESRILKEFAAHPDADIMVFHLDTDSERKAIRYSKTKKCRRFSRRPWGAVRIAFRLEKVRKANLWFTTLFGGGCVFPAGEDSMWLAEARRKGLTFYVSRETIGKISYEKSSWFTGYDEKYYFGQGAYYQALHPVTFPWWMLFSVVRTYRYGKLPVKEKLEWIRRGAEGYRNMIPYENWKESMQVRIKAGNSHAEKENSDC